MKTSLPFQTTNLKQNTSIQIGPVVKYLEVTNEENLLVISNYAKKNKLKIHVLGEGTNCYFAKNLKQYLFIKLSLSQEIIFKEKGREDFLVTASANTNWNSLVEKTVENNLWGLENLTLIPGSVGAAPVQNIGAYGVELRKTFYSAKVFDTVKNKFIILKNKDCKFSYRDSVFKQNKNRYIILSVTLKLSSKRKAVLTYSPLNKLDKKNVSVQEVSELVRKVRQEKLPDYKIYPNSGSFIKNPKVNATQLKKLQSKFPGLVFFTENEKEKTIYKIPIAWFIEHIIKMKGVVVGNFGTYKNHSLVFVNHEGLGDAKELNNYVKLISKKLTKVTGLSIEQEVNFIS